MLLTITSVSPWSRIPTSTTTLSWLLTGATYTVALWLCFQSRAITRLPYQSLLLAYLGWVLVAAARGAWVAENYWEYKFLIQGTAAVLIPLLIWPLASPEVLGTVLKYWMRLALPLFGLYYFLLSPDAYGFYLAPLVLFLLLLPLFKFPQQLLMLLFAGIVIFSNLDGRSNILRFSFPLLFTSLFLVKHVLGATAIRCGMLALFLLPPILLVLGSSGTFNIFKMQEYIRPEAIGLSATNYKTATADTRTFIYDEVWQSATRHHYVWTGRSLARGYDSNWFGNHALKDLGTGKKERYSSEVGIMNIFNWMGVSWVLLYSALFLIACKLAIYNSASFSLKLIGLYVAFRWAYCWVEEFTTFGINYFTLWMLVAICYSTQFRAMTDNEIGAWLRGIVPGNWSFRRAKNVQ